MTADDILFACVTILPLVVLSVSLVIICLKNA